MLKEQQLRLMQIGSSTHRKKSLQVTSIERTCDQAREKKTFDRWLVSGLRASIVSI